MVAITKTNADPKVEEIAHFNFNCGKKKNYTLYFPDFDVFLDFNIAGFGRF